MTSSFGDASPIDTRPMMTAAPRAAFEVVTLAGSAGGPMAVRTVLNDLGPDFQVPILVVLHLPPESKIVETLRHLPFTARWAETGMLLAPGTVVFCPPRSFVEVLPDGSCVVSPCERGAVDKPIDRALASVGRSFGSSALSVVLTGMGDDGAQGARELHDLGGCVIAQSDASAEQASMPRAAIAAGAADHVAPLSDIGSIVVELVAGIPTQDQSSEVAAVVALFGSGDPHRSALAATDWSRTALGPVRGWSPALKGLVRMVIDHPFGMNLMWGEDLVQITNETFAGIFDRRIAGVPAKVAWTDIWDVIHADLESVLQTGIPVSRSHVPLAFNEKGSFREAYYEYAVSPLRVDGRIAGVLSTNAETTERVVAERRLQTLRALSSAGIGGGTVRDVAARLAVALGTNAHDVPFALLYLIEQRSKRANLVAATGLAFGSEAAPHFLVLDDLGATWPVGIVASAGGSFQVDDLATRFPGFHAGPWPEAPGSALLLGLRSSDATGMSSGVLVLGINPRLRFDAMSRDFFELVAASVSALLADARVREFESQRLEQLAELDRAKTEFFANVSHEFRTPLTLMLAPLDELIRSRDELPARLANEVDVAARNARRLRTLVGHLLDFSREESRRPKARVEEVDLCTLTSDIASHFRSAIEAAGLTFEVQCHSGLPLVPVDVEMWTQVVSNLLSNAFKFTSEGKISVALTALRLHAELAVTDTGVGIAADELPNLFKRFHRVQGVRARTAEGAGIGLSLVHDFVKRMGGDVTVRSREGIGTTFTVWMPLKSLRGGTPPSEKQSSVAITRQSVADLADAAQRWLPDAERRPDDVIDLGGEPTSPGSVDPAPFARPRILVVDDNADMRGYLRRTLDGQFEVETAADGESAFTLARRLLPEAIVADVMMPGLDGFELLRHIREDRGLANTPVVLVTARTGEEAAIKGLRAGADDYISKPFSPRELVTRIQAVTERHRAERSLRESEARLRAYVSASSDVVYRMSADWKEMRQLDGKRFIPDTLEPSRSWLDMYILPDDAESVTSAIARAIQDKTVFELEHRVIRGDGSIGWTFSRAVPVFDDLGEIVEWVGTAREIAAR